MIGCVWTRVRKQPIIVLYFEPENELKFYNLEARYADNNEDFRSMLWRWSQNENEYDLEIPQSQTTYKPVAS